MGNTKKERFLQRKRRVSAKIFGTSLRPRLSVFRSNRFIYAQLIDDEAQKTLVAASSKGKEAGKEKTKVARALAVGKILAKKASVKKIKKAVFDKSGYKYHGQVEALADGAREGGLEF